MKLCIFTRIIRVINNYQQNKTQTMSHLSDIEIAQAKKLAHITTIAKK